MPRTDNPHSLRLIAAVSRRAGAAAADELARSHPLSKSADADKKAHWACEVCKVLEKQFDADTASAIRRDCRCGDGATMAKEIRACIAKAENLADGCALFTTKNKYAFLEYISEHEVLFGYHACVCSCVKRAAEPVPLLWCECSAGYAETMLRQALGSDVHATLRKSAKSGADRCEFLINW